MSTDGKASPGSVFRPPPASIWNNMVDAGRAWADTRLGTGQSPPGGPRSTDVIKVLNDCGEDRRKGEVLEISGKAITAVTDENPWLTGVEPDAGFFGILTEPALDGSVASLQVSGYGIALVDILDTAHTRADIVSTEYVLASGDAGPLELLYAPSTIGEQECVVRFAVSGNRRRCILCEDLAAATDLLGDPSTATAILLYVGSDGRLHKEPKGGTPGRYRTITVVNYFEQISLSAGTYCKVESVGENEWEPYAADCGPFSETSSSWACSSSS